jgi:CysZ protein
MSGLVNGFLSYAKALPYLLKGWALKYLVLTGILAIASLAVMVGIVFFKGDELVHVVLNLFNLDLIPWLDTGLEWVVRGILWVICILLFKYLILILASPFLSIVSNKVESAINGESVQATNEEGFMGLGRAVSVSGGNLINEILLTIPLLIFSLIPGVAIVTTPLIFIIQAYYVGYGNLDTYLENKFSTKESKSFVKGNRGLAVANGSVFLGLLLIPFLGVFLAPIWSIIAVTIAGESKLRQQATV